MRIAIVGAGIEGCCLAHMLLDLNPEIEISIFDARAEVGIPPLGSGYIENQSLFKQFEIWGINTVSVFPIDNAGFFGVRRDLLEKQFSLSLTKRGVSISVKTRVETQSNNSLKLFGAGPMIGELDGIQLIDTRADSKNVIFGAIFNNNTEDAWQRGDETWEKWSSTEFVNSNVLELMVVNGDSISDISVDAAYTRAENLLSDFITQFPNIN